MIPTDQLFYTKAEAAAALGIPLRTLCKEMERRRISYQRRPFRRGNICFQRSDLLAYLDRVSVPARK